jgi:hypothetical protein
MRKYIKMFEELSFTPQSIQYEYTDSENIKYYQFVYLDYTFTVEFTKQVVDKQYDIYAYDEVSENEEITLSGWRRDFYTEENGYETLNHSTTTALKIYAYVSQVTQDFINLVQPEFVITTHTSMNRFRINLKYVNNLKIPGYEFGYKIGSYPKTIIYQPKFTDHIRNLL